MREQMQNHDADDQARSELPTIVLPVLVGQGAGAFGDWSVIE